MNYKKIIVIIAFIVIIIAFIVAFIVSLFSEIDSPIHFSAEPISFEEIKISWEGDKNADRFYLYRANDPEGHYRRIASVRESEYNDKGLTPNTRYYYKVSQVVELNESPRSFRVSAVTYPGKPEGVEISTEDYQQGLKLEIELSWDHYRKAEEYTVYRSKQSGGPYEKIATTFTENYIDKDIEPETTYYYVITQTANEMESIYSEEVHVTSFSQWSCGEELEYGDRSYETLQMGYACWFAENLSIKEEEIDRDCSFSTQCYRGDEVNCDIYGKMYDFSDISCNETSKEIRGICPLGWRVPSDEDWQDLEIFLGSNKEDLQDYGIRGEEVQTGSKIAGEYGLWTPGALTGSDQFSLYDFNALPGGILARTFREINEKAFFWSSTSAQEDSECRFSRSQNIRARIIKYDSTGIELDCIRTSDKAYVRCMRDY